MEVKIALSPDRRAPRLLLRVAGEGVRHRTAGVAVTPAGRPRRSARAHAGNTRQVGGVRGRATASSLPC